MSLWMNNRPLVSNQYQETISASKYRITSILFRIHRLFELDRCRRFARAIVEHAVDVLDLIDDPAGDGAQNIPRHVIALSRHEVGGGDSAQSHGVVLSR